MSIDFFTSNDIETDINTIEKIIDTNIFSSKIVIILL